MQFSRLVGDRDYLSGQTSRYTEIIARRRAQRTAELRTYILAQ